jgi:hypothetical protein
MRAAQAIGETGMPLPDWLKQHDEADEPQPAAATPAPEEEPEVEEPQFQEPEVQEPEIHEPEAQEPAVQPRELQELEDIPAAAPATEAIRREPQVIEDEVPPTGNDQVLGMLSAIEQQLRQLGDVQRQHEDQLGSLIERTAQPAAGGSEPADAEPQQKQPSFVVEMDDQEQTPQGAEDRQGLEDMASELETSRQQTDQMRQQLEDAQTRIQEIAGESNGGGVQDMTEELAEAHEKIETLQSRVIELEAVAAVSGDDDDDSDEKDEQIAALTEQSVALTEQVAQMQEALDSRDEEQEQPVPAPPPDSAGAEMIERQRKQIERLTEQLTAVNAGGDPGDIQRRDARIAELEEELEELQEGAGKQGVSKLVAGFGGALRQVRGKKSSGDAEEVAELEERIAELEVECQQLRDATPQGGAGAGSGDDSEEVIALRARVAQLEKNPAAAGGELRSKVETEFKQKWNELKLKQDDLKATEKKMKRQWARPQAIVVFGWLAGLAILVAIVSWFIAGRLLPATIAASVNVEAKTRTGVPVEDQDKADWQQVHTAMLTDEAFQKTVAKRLGDQRFDDYKDPDKLAEYLEENLSVDSPKPGAMTLTLAGTNQRETAAVLDTVATTLSTWSSQQAGKRGDGAIAIVRGERREAGQVRYATINDTPIKSRRPMGALVIFLVGFMLSFLMITRISQGLLKAKSAMEEDEFGVSADVF